MKEIKKILVTGGAGYIGSVLVPKLLHLGYEVKVFDNLTYSNSGIKDLFGNPLFSFIEADIRDLEKVKQSLNEVDCIIHLAAISNDPSAELDQSLTREINYDAYLPLIQYAKKAGVHRFINPSSIGVYGINFDNYVNENDPVNPLTEYARCKVKSEVLIKEQSSSDFTAVSLRCGTVCGWSSRMRFDLSVNTLTAVALNNKRLTVWGGGQKRPQIHIDDITNFFVSLVMAPSIKINGKIFNAAGHNTEVMQIAETIKKVLNNDLELISAPPREDERSYCVSSELIEKELGLFPKKTIEDAVIDIVKAYHEGKWNNYLLPIYNNVKQIKENKLT
ncbi:MAG: NAD-dependent epimerase/dehydratase family protein [Bacteroidetes bacterium]|nr:NAD-dependent epimerase/dehydratase family protein [Bacteroidota bacterium]